MREEWQEYLAEEFNGDIDAMWVRGFSIMKDALTFNDLLQNANSSAEKHLIEDYSGDLKLMKKALF